MPSESDSTGPTRQESPPKRSNEVDMRIGTLPFELSPPLSFQDETNNGDRTPTAFEKQPEPHPTLAGLPSLRQPLPIERPQKLSLDLPKRQSRVIGGPDTPTTTPTTRPVGPSTEKNKSPLSKLNLNASAPHLPHQSRSQLTTTGHVRPLLRTKLSDQNLSNPVQRLVSGLGPMGPRSKRPAAAVIVPQAQAQASAQQARAPLATQTAESVISSNSSASIPASVVETVESVMGALHPAPPQPLHNTPLRR